MTIFPTIARPSLLDRFRAMLKAKKCLSENMDLQIEIHLRGQEVAILNKGLPIQIQLGKNGKKLYMYPDLSPKFPHGEAPHSMIIIDPDTFFSKISGFIRLEYKETILLGRGQKDQDMLFQYPKSVARRHLSIRHAGASIIFKDLDAEVGTYVSTLTDPALMELPDTHRQECLEKLKKIYGGAFQPLPHNKALATIRQVNSLFFEEKYRVKDSRNLPGGVIQLPENMTPIIVGDLHGQVDNLLKILTEGSFLKELEQSLAYLLILGDAVHLEIDGQMEEMTSSMLMMDFIFRLKIHFPHQVFYIRGNHDSFSPDIRKGGVIQGVLWERKLRMERGEEYVNEMNLFYDRLPFVALSNDFITCHAAPPKAKADLNLLINTHQYPGLIHELIWNRLQRPNYPAGYNKGDVKRFRKALFLDEKTPLIVAHNPLTQEESVWLNAGEIENHHIVFSGRPTCIAIFSRFNGEIAPLIFPTESMIY
ncbi:MAG: metallophosphoesterase [Magnetococcus sp. DMHC-6]